MSAQPYIPSRLVRPLVVEWEHRRALENGVTPGAKAPGSRVLLAELSGVHERTIQRIVNGEQETVALDRVDALLVAMDMQEEWWFGLAEFRWGLDE